MEGKFQKEQRCWCSRLALRVIFRLIGLQETPVNDLPFHSWEKSANPFTHVSLHGSQKPYLTPALSHTSHRHPSVLHNNDKAISGGERR